MIALSFSQVTKVYNEQKVLNQVSFSINAKDRLGIVGKNGAGKTTLLKIITGLEQADTGDLFLEKNARIGYMEQGDDFDPRQTLLDFCLEAFSHLISLEEQLMHMEEQMGHFQTDSEAFHTLMENYHDLSEHFDHLGGHVFRSKVRGILIGLGFSEDGHTRTLDALSGGQFARLKLARLLINEPDILILDEPTNHLDIQTTNWLENYLKQYPYTLIMVSHDRFFLDSICTKILEIELGQALLFEGNYTVFKQKKAAQIEQMIKQHERALKERAKQEALIRKFKQHGTEKLAKRARSREKRLDHFVVPDAVQTHTKNMSLSLNTKHSSGNEVLHVEGLYKHYGDAAILEDINFDLYKGEKIGLIGHNGCGKSTLLRVIEGSLPFEAGTIKFGHHVLQAYYDQAMDTLNPDLTIKDEIHEMVPAMNEEEIRTLLGRFLFSNEEVFKPINVLSGGEKARVQLTKLFLTEANFLLLDEPTNHLDLYSKEVLEEALIDFEGSLLVVSHDRYFLDRVCDQIIEIDQKTSTLYHGNYSYYVDKKSALNAPKETEDTSATKTAQKAAKKQEKEKQARQRADQKQFIALENQIHDTEERLTLIHELLCDETVYSNSEKTKELLEEQASLEALLETLYHAWAEFEH